MNLQSIKRATADYYGIPMTELTGPCRKQAFTHPRQLAMFVALKHTKKSKVQIGTAFGGRDHTTVMHAERAVARRMDEETRDAIRKIEDAAIGFVFRTSRIPHFKSTRTQ